MASEMMCAMRRQLSGGREILLAGELLAGQHIPEPEFGFQPAVGCRVTRPVTSAWALMLRQSGKFGTLSTLVICSMIGGGIDRQRTGRCAAGLR